MKKSLHALMGALLFLTPMVLCAFLIYGNGFNPGFQEFLLEGLMDSPLYGVFAGLALLLLVLVYLATFGAARSRSRYIAFEGESGSVSISANAVRDFVRKIGDEFSAVVSMDPRVRPEKNRVSMDLNVKIQTGTKLPELSALLQTRVRESIRDGLGIDNVRDIKVIVQEIVGVPPVPAPEKFK
jgi:uncharacterized alkaline shock family protein YloU